MPLCIANLLCLHRMEAALDLQPHSVMKPGYHYGEPHLVQVLRVSHAGQKTTTDSLFPPCTIFIFHTSAVCCRHFLMNILISNLPF